ncbi:hypothetical protein H1235_07755 [Pseudoxanthomonas sp. NC8]|nr:hypothetical protein H1235_07755 [Pseudoxanthomonas sp. NC8]
MGDGDPVPVVHRAGADPAARLEPALRRPPPARTGRVRCRPLPGRRYILSSLLLAVAAILPPLGYWGSRMPDAVDGARMPGLLALAMLGLGVFFPVAGPAPARPVDAAGARPAGPRDRTPARRRIASRMAEPALARRPTLLAAGLRVPRRGLAGAGPRRKPLADA